MKKSEKSKIVNYGINFLIGIIFAVLLYIVKEKIHPIVTSRVSAKKLEMVAYVIFLLVDIYFLGHAIYDLIKLKTGKLKAEPLDHETERDKYKKDLISYIVSFIFLTLCILILIRGLGYIPSSR